MQLVKHVVVFVTFLLLSLAAIAQNFGGQDVIARSYSLSKDPNSGYRIHDRNLDGKVFALYSAGNIARIWHNDTPSQDLFKFTSTGRMGIGLGAANPATRLHIGGDENSAEVNMVMAGRMQMISPQAGIFFLLPGGVHKYFFGNANNHGLGMYSSSTLKWHLLMKDNGTFVMAPDAVAVQPPTGYRLVVRGKTITEEVRVLNSANWPDYVFAKDYPLLPLAELDQYIKTHNRLPNLPTAGEVESEGFDLGDMQKKLLEKVEELTLYTIQLHKENQSLRSELDSLKSTVKTKKRRR